MTFWEYDTITLALYIEVSTTGKYRKLIKKGWARSSDCHAQFEKILQMNGMASGDLSFLKHIDDLQGFNSLMNEYNFVKAALIKLLLKVDRELIGELNVMYGYKIDTSSSEAYAASLYQAFISSENIITQLTIRRNEMDMDIDEGEQPITLEQILANISFQLGFPIESNITLARYNEYKKILLKKAKRTKEADYV